MEGGQGGIFEFGTERDEIAGALCGDEVTCEKNPDFLFLLEVDQVEAKRVSGVDEGWV